jgi:hypothetical protein
MHFPDEPALFDWRQRSINCTELIWICTVREEFAAFRWDYGVSDRRARFRAAPTVASKKCRPALN